MIKQCIAVFFICVIPVIGYSQSIKDFETSTVTIGTVKGVKITAYKGLSKDVIIPAVFDGKRLIEIGEQSFMFRGLTHVLIPEGVLAIGRQAFFGNQLTDIYLPRSILKVDNSAFDNNRIINLYKNYTGDVNSVDNLTVRQNREGAVVGVDVIPPASGAYTIETSVIAKDPAIKPYFNGFVPAKQSWPVLIAEPDTTAAIASPVSPPVNVKPAPVAAKAKTAPSETPKNSGAGKNQRNERQSNQQDNNQQNSEGRATGTFYLQDQGNGTAIITGYRTNLKDAVIPNSINGLVITRIGTGAFMDKKLSSVSIPPAVEYIGDAAFTSNQLSNVIIPESVRTIGNQAFAGNQIQGLVIGSGVLVQLDSFLNNFSDFYNLNGRQAGTYVWDDGRWEYVAPDGVRSITEEYLLPADIRALPYGGRAIQ
jgi:hypothetical protein